MRQAVFDSLNARRNVLDGRPGENAMMLQRGAIFGAGVAMNAVFAIVVFAVAFSLGVPLPPALVGDILPGTQAAASELRVGDRVVSVNGKPMQDFNDLVSAVAFSTAGEGLVLEIERAGERSGCSGLTASIPLLAGPCSMRRMTRSRRARSSWSV